MATKVREEKKLKLSLFLVKAGLENIEDFLDVAGLRKIPIDVDGALGTLYVKSGFPSQPPWVSIFSDVPGFNPKSIVNMGSRGVYVIRASDRWFCFTFGYARHLINELAIERNFGLIVALNLGDPNAIKAIDKTNISHIGLQSREQAGRDTAFGGFEFDTEIDLLKSMTAKGVAADGDDEQETYSGRDSVTICTRVSLATLSDLASRLFKAYNKKGYQKTYPWIDKITQVRDSAAIQKLDGLLVEGINAGQSPKIWFAVPEIVAWEEIDGFSYKHKTPNPKKAGPALHPDLDLDNWVDELDIKGAVTLNHLHSRKIFRHMKDGDEPMTWAVYGCLNAEIDSNNSKYILNDGEWYNVDRDYVEEVDHFYRSVPESRLELPDYGMQTEPIYLKNLRKTHPQYDVMDRKEVMIGGGRSRVEFCDLYSKTRDIIHVKQYGGSAPLSHLFSQAVTSGESFLHEVAFREKVNEYLSDGFKLDDAKLMPRAGDYTVCLAIMSRVPGPLELPFFSKVSLKHAVRTLQRMGYGVTKLKISR